MIKIGKRYLLNSGVATISNNKTYVMSNNEQSIFIYGSRERLRRKEKFYLGNLETSNGKSTTVLIEGNGCVWEEFNETYDYFSGLLGILGEEKIKKLEFIPGQKYSFDAFSDILTFIGKNLNKKDKYNLIFCNDQGNLRFYSADCYLKPYVEKEKVTGIMRKIRYSWGDTWIFHEDKNSPLGKNKTIKEIEVEFEC